MKTSLLEDLMEEAESGNVAYTEFMLDYGKDPDVLYCFMEGDEDFHYYNVRIRESLGKIGSLEYSCNGKEGVLEAYRLIKDKPEFSLTKLAFFVDRDFDPAMANPDIYETPCHSIEKLYTDKITIARLLKEIFKMKNKSVDYEKCIKTYSILLDEFRKKTLPLNSWIACYIDKRNLKSIQKQISLKSRTDKLFLKVVSNDLSQVTIKPGLENFEELQVFFDNKLDVSKSAFTLKQDAFSVGDPAYTNKGKFEFEFLGNFLNALKDQLIRKNNSFCSTAYKCKINFQLDTLLFLLSNIAKTPDCLKEYIKGVAA